MSMKPILFNTEMVKAIMDGRKTVTRRIIKPQPGADAKMAYTYAAGRKQDWGKWRDLLTGQQWNPPYHADDILYVRETWAFDTGDADDEIGTGYFAYRADDLHHPDCKWRPSIHMPKEAARIFLRVKRVSVERLQAITVDQVAAEGIDSAVPCDESEELCNYCPLPDEAKGVHCYGGAPAMCEGKCCPEAMDAWEEEFIGEFAELWDSTIKPSDLPAYGWYANPWVWVIEFERCEKPKEDPHGK